MLRAIKKTVFFVLTIILTVMASMGWFIFKHYQPISLNEHNPVWVKVAKVEILALPQEIHSLGSLVARGVEISPELAGHIEKIAFTDGAFVKAGTVLIQLNDTIYRNKYASANAKLIYSEANFKRMNLLGKKGIVTQQAIDQAEADLKEKKAEADENRTMLDRMKLVAPFAGTLGKSKVTLGEYVTIGQSIVSLTDTKNLRIEYTVPEKYLPLIKLGQKVKIKTPAYPDKQFTGTVAFISPTIDRNNRSIAVYAELNNEDNLLKSGMFVDVIQLVGKFEQVLTVPAKTLVPVLEGQLIYKVVNEKAYAVNVVVGKRMEDKVQILQGLKSTDSVITDGQFKVKNNMPVKVEL